MNEEDVPRSPALGALISRARQDGPSRARLDGVRARLESQLGPLGPSVDAAPPPPPRPDVSSSSSWVVPTTIVIGVIALFVIGRSLLGSETPAPVAPIAPTSTSTSPAPRPEADPPREVVSPSSTAVSAEGSEAEPATETEVGEAPPSGSPARPSRVAHDDPSAVEGPVPSDDPSSTLREEVALMERAMRHRREGDLAAMRAVLAEHAARFPNGHLAPERTRLLGELAAPSAEGETP
jgi:hypothetical protein